MKPRVEAERLIKKFSVYTEANAIVNKSIAKQLALMCVREIQHGIKNSAHGGAYDFEIISKKEEFWNNVADIIKHA